MKRLQYLLKLKLCEKLGLRFCHERIALVYTNIVQIFQFQVINLSVSGTFERR